MSVELSITGVERLFRSLSNIREIHRALRPPMEQAMRRIRRGMAAEPGPIPAGHWRANTTERQRRFFFAALREGRIHGGRSGAYVRGWNVDIKEDNFGTVGTVYNTVAHAPFVGRKGRQAKFLQGRWPADEDVLARAGPGIVREFDRAIDEALN